jgi:geranylgeranyl diphosphate synthase type II
MTRSAPEILARHAATVARLLETLPTRWLKDSAPPPLVEAIMYSLRAGGKRIRPALILESFAAAQGSESARPAAEAAALAMEMIHTFSLVHDDLPAMDDDDLRRGMPTSHVKFGEAAAILAGDAMLSGAFEVLADLPDATIALRLAGELARATGPTGMIGGQSLDIAAEGRTATAEELANIHRMKTGALLVASCRCGAIAAAAPPATLDSLTAFGRHAGLAFQIVDDILDVTSTPEALGKATGKDTAKGKNTYPAIHGLEASRQKAADELRLAEEALAPLGQPAGGLREICRYIVSRSH